MPRVDLYSLRSTPGELQAREAAARLVEILGAKRPLSRLDAPQHRICAFVKFDTRSAYNEFHCIPQEARGVISDGSRMLVARQPKSPNMCSIQFGVLLRQISSLCINLC